ncbi:tetratricopeptide repeat protein [Pseudoroseomonas cervicalis]|uniref:tetratricopeptide repeat protein n=1 Tax=Teichococcus cervicalis TaxID=204525 RepID=UPI0022F178C0|nr:tetratricopeptide repeat protein [Pseudoroseomonas cervicalis]WBV45275.1 tetratricopeptide repeat protein [Pseudoroseomonas cervicalis]
MAAPISAAGPVQPAAWQPLLQQAEALLRQGEAGPAEALLRQALATDPPPAPLRLRLARLLIDQARWAEAEALLLAQLAATPGLGEVQHGLALLREGQGAPQEAERLLRQWLERRPQAASPALWLAALLARRDRLAEAAEVLEAALVRQPGHAGLLRDLAALRDRQGDAAGAEALLRRRIAAAADPVHPALLLAKRLEQQGRLAEAEALLAPLLEARPEEPALLLAQGRLLARQSRPAEAMALFARATALPAAPAEAWIGWSRAAGRLLPMVTLLDGLQHARRTLPPHAGLERELAEQLLRFGAQAEATALLDAATARFPEEAELRRLRLRLALLDGRHAEAEALLETLPAITPAQRRRRLRLLAGLRKAQWRLEEALALQQEAAAAPDATVEDHRVLATLRLMLLDVSGARDSLAQALRLAPQRRQANVSQSLAGEILNDFAIDRAALEAARAARQADDLAAWCAVPAAFPDHTGAALAFLLALRRSGRLAPRPAGMAALIPHRLHQFWDTPPPPADVAVLAETWRTHHPGWRHRLYSAAEARAFLAAQPDARLLRAFQRLPSVTAQADLFRLAVLFAEGGVYADADDRCAAPLDGLLAGRGLVLRQEHYGTAGNNIIAARPAHPVIGLALEQAVQAALRGDRESIWLSSGPGLMTRCLAQYLAAAPAHMAELGGTLLLLDQHEMRRHCVSGCQAFYKQSPRYWQAAEFRPGGAALAAWR